MSPSIFSNWLLAIILQSFQRCLSPFIVYCPSLTVSVALTKILTHCGLATPYGDTDMGQHWHMWWLVVTTLSHYLNECRPVINYVLMHSHESNFAKSTYKVFFSNMCSEITLLKQLPYLPGATQLTFNIYWFTMRPQHYLEDVIIFAVENGTISVDASSACAVFEYTLPLHACQRERWYC